MDKKRAIEITGGNEEEADWLLRQFMPGEEEHPEHFGAVDTYQVAKDAITEQEERVLDPGNATPGDDLLAALYFSFIYGGFPLSERLRERYVEYYRNYLFFHDEGDYKTPLLEKTFKTDVTVNKHRFAKSREHRHALDVVRYIENAKSQGTPVDEGLFEKAGEQVNISGSLARNWYYKWRDSYFPALE